jgi:hypothetical protein
MATDAPSSDKVVNRSGFRGAAVVSGVKNENRRPAAFCQLDAHLDGPVAV